MNAEPLGLVLWALVDFQLTPLTRNNLPVAVFVCLFVVVFLFVVVLFFWVFLGGVGGHHVYLNNRTSGSKGGMIESVTRHLLCVLYIQSMISESMSQIDSLSRMTWIATTW